ncbi:hypothetical protein VHEMI02816 [[Torrubiella] hemipterigena]|uniref:Uncharacterized protein n=1 Tax=[Torrubiella] hemipterigena TaxID=1531966 RepID=A0A0A1SQS4_9HYPO|nr:hypothetical protein VHEMI02816 [[Torrubiella] hemipterigena]
MELTTLLSFLAIALPNAYGAPTTDANNMHPELLHAMKRDLGLNAEQAATRIADDHKATELITKLTESIGSDKFAGGWISAGKTYVGVTDKAAKDHVTAAGAVPVIMNTTLSKLEAAKKAIDDHLSSSVRARDNTKADPNLAGIASYFIDVAKNKLIVESLAENKDQARALAARGNLSDAEYEIRVVKSLPSAAADVVGGWPYVAGGLTCSYGFAVQGGFISAGHCAHRGDTVTVGTSQGGEYVGQFVDSRFPGNDMSYAQTGNNVKLWASVSDYNGRYYSIRGSQEAAQGASVCRSGAKTGLRCGYIQGKGQTVVLDQVNTVYDLTRTSACCDHGDSGGSFFTGDQAQGVTSATNGGCNSGGICYYQPVNPILQTYNVRLLTQ